MQASEEQVAFNSKEHQILEQVAQKLGLTVEEAANFLAKQALSKRANRPVKVPGQVVPFQPRSRA